MTLSAALARSSIAARFGPALLVRISLTPPFSVTRPARRHPPIDRPAVKSRREEGKAPAPGPASLAIGYPTRGALGTTEEE